MSAINTYIKRHPVVMYYVLTFAISWGGVLLVIGGPGGIPATMQEFETLLPFAILAYLAGRTNRIQLTLVLYAKGGCKGYGVSLNAPNVTVRDLVLCVNCQGQCLDRR